MDKLEVQKKIKFINDYATALNAATGSKYDANSNVGHKNIATLENEIHKGETIAINRGLMCQKIEELFGRPMAEQYVKDLESHICYTHDESSLKPYCVSINMWPFLNDGLTKLGGESRAPKHLASYCGNFVNLVFAISSQFAGAVATVEFLMHFDHFARKDYGKGYLKERKGEIENHLQHVVYALNQPAAARGYQSVFWNISVFDEPYFHGMFEGFTYPDLDEPDFESLKELQAFFLDWLNEERRKAVLTFPVVTAAVLTDGEKPVDEEFARMCTENMAKGGSFFVYMSDTPDSLASCCRLRNETSNQFSHSLGAGGVATGSLNVITMNLNRIIQAGEDVGDVVSRIHKYQIAYRKIMEGFLDAGLLTVYDAGFITMDKQYLTIGVNGAVEAAEFLGLHASDNVAYREWLKTTLSAISVKNREAAKEYGVMFNTEFVPAENLGVKHYQWDKEDGLVVPEERVCYNSYFYPVEADLDIISKFRLHGQDITQYLDGGSALHLNLETYLTPEGFYQLFVLAAKTGCNYWCYNVAITICNECEHICKFTRDNCEDCGSVDVDHATRVIGYLTRVSRWSHKRQVEHGLRKYHQ